jgi:porin
MKNVEGATIPVELIWKPKLAALDGLAGEYKLGALYSTADANDVKTAAKVHDGKHSFWINAQQQLTQQDHDPKRGLFMSVNAVVNDKATTTVQSTQQIAFWYKGLLDNRPNDSVGLGFANYVVNERARDRQIQTNQSNGYDEYDALAGNYIPVQRDELNIELNYTYQWSPAVMLRPNIQYIHQPAGVKEVEDAWVVGLTSRFNF